MVEKRILGNTNPPRTIADQILEIVEENPGIKASQIRWELGKRGTDITSRRVRERLVKMVAQGKLVRERIGIEREFRYFTPNTAPKKPVEPPKKPVLEELRGRVEAALEKIKHLRKELGIDPP